jgi:1-pyrroline-5-carboxylate dehydrogenase
MWSRMRDRLVATIDDIRVGNVADFTNFMGAVIDAKAFQKISDYIETARRSADATILAGGVADDSIGYFIRPTLVLTKNPAYTTMCEEIFGPVITVYVYPEKEWRATLDVIDQTSPYALTGAVLATDRRAVEEARDILRYAAGNFYINDKPTGAVVGQQPFGGARASGTNDKAGSRINLLRWVSARTIKETFNPPKDYRYPFMS